MGLRKIGNVMEMPSFCPAEQPGREGENIQPGTGVNHKSAQRTERDLHLVPKGDGSIVHRWEGKQWLEKVILVQRLLLMIFALTVKSPPFPPPPQETAVNGLSWTLWWVFRHNFSQMSNNFDPLHFRLLKQ